MHGGELMPFLLLLWNNKRWSLIIVLLIYAFFQTWQSNRLTGDLAKSKTECQNKIDKAVTSAKKPYLDAEAAAKKKANEVSEQYEVTKNEERIKTEVITRTVEKIVDRPIYLNVCFDADGVSAVNQAASIISTGKPKTGLP